MSSGSLPASIDEFLPPGGPVVETKKEKSRKRVSKACVYCQRSHMSCDEGRPCKRCLSRGMADLCRDGKCKRRGRKRKSEMGSVEDPDNDTDDEAQKVRGRPRKFVTDVYGNPMQTNDLALVEAKREVVDESNLTIIGGTSAPMMVVGPSMGYDLMGDQSSRSYYNNNGNMQSMQRLEDNSMGSIFSAYSMYPNVPVPMFQTTSSQGYLMKGDDSIFSLGDYPPGLIESSNDLFDFELLALTE